MLLSELKKAFQPLLDISHKEKSVEVMGIKITLRSLTPTQEVEIQKCLPDLQDTESSPIEFVDVFRMETLAHAIVEVQGQSLRDQEFIFTGEETSSGVPVKMTKVDAVKDVMSAWPRPVLSLLFNEFTSLVEELESDVSSAISTEPDLPDAEKEIGEKRAQDINRALDMEQVVSRQSEMTSQISVVEDLKFSDALKEVGT